MGREPNPTGPNATIRVAEPEPVDRLAVDGDHDRSSVAIELEWPSVPASEFNLESVSESALPLSRVSTRVAFVAPVRPVR